MLTFKEWLAEAVKVRLYKKDHPEAKDSLGEIEHRQDIDGNYVKTIFTVKPRRKVDVDFTVNDSFMSRSMSDAAPKTKEKIMRHVSDTIDSWVARNKPRELSMTSNHPDKDAVYRAFMTRLAAKHGYKDVRRDKAGVLPRLTMSDGPSKERKKA